jgi:hypothetical protein
MPTLSGRRRVSGTAKHFGNFAANTVMTALVRARFFDIRPAPVFGSICTASHDNHATVSETKRPGQTGRRTCGQHLNFHQIVGLG